MRRTEGGPYGSVGGAAGCGAEAIRREPDVPTRTHPGSRDPGLCTDARCSVHPRTTSHLDDEHLDDDVGANLDNLDHDHSSRHVRPGSGCQLGRVHPDR